MDPVGIWVVGLVLAAGLSGGAWWRRSNGRLRDVAPVLEPERGWAAGVRPEAGRRAGDGGVGRVAPVDNARAALDRVASVDNGGEVSAEAALLDPTQQGVGAGEAAPGGPDGKAAPGGPDGKAAPGGPDGKAAPGGPDGKATLGGPDGKAAAGLPLDAGMLAGLGVEVGGPVTLLQFSSAYCAPCRAVRRISSEVVGEVPGVRHVEVDAEEHLDAARSLGVWRTPTLLVLDRGGRVVKRASGVPKKPDLVAAVRETL